MKDFFDVLKEFMPLWLVLITLGFGYLVYLYTKIFKQTNELAEKQNQYYKERIDVIDKATSIYERTFLQQDKSIEQLNFENKKLKKDLENSIKKFQHSIDLTDKIEQEKAIVQTVVEYSYIEMKLKDLYVIYQGIRATFIYAENITGKVVLPSINEFRYSFDHIMHSFSDNANIDKEFTEAREHLFRAGFNAAEVIVLNKIETIHNLLRDFNAKSIAKVYPEYYTEVRPLLLKIQTELSLYRNSQESFSHGERFKNYERNIFELIDYEGKINLIIPQLSSKKRFILFKSKS